MADKDIEELAKVRPVKGSLTAKRKLQELNHDPLTALVNVARELERDDEYHRNVREEKIVPLSETGRVLRYNPLAHVGVRNQQIAVNKELMRFAYPDEELVSDEQNEKIPRFNVTLTLEGEVVTDE